LIPATREPGIVYLHFLRMPATLRFEEQTFVYVVYGGYTFRSLHERLWNHHGDRALESTHGHYKLWNREGVIDAGFFGIADYTENTPQGVRQITEGFEIAALGLWESLSFPQITSQLQLLVVRDCRYRHFGLELYGNGGLISRFADMKQRTEIVRTHSRDRAHELVMLGFAMSYSVKKGVLQLAFLDHIVLSESVPWVRDHPTLLDHREAIPYLSICQVGEKYSNACLNFDTK